MLVASSYTELLQSSKRMKIHKNTLQFERVRIPHSLKILIGISVTVIAIMADFFQSDTRGGTIQ